MTITANKRNGRNRGTDQAVILAWLRQADCYPERPERVEFLETHMSYLFFAGQHVYKMKKPVHNDYLDLRTVEARRRHCGEEVRLNRRLAADVYHGIVPLKRCDEGDLQLCGEGGVVVEWLVKMRRLPSERMLDELIEHDRLSGEDIARLGNVLTDFYSRSPSAALGGREYIREIENSLETDRQALATVPNDFSDWYIPVFQSLQDALAVHGRLLEFRVTEGRIVEGHGDLRPEHVCLEPLPVIFDCLVFDYRLRVIDPVDELVFLAMECAKLGADWVEALLFRSYTDGTGDTPPLRLIAFYKCCRALRWARLACRRMAGGEDEEKWRRRAEGYLRLAVRYSSELA